MSGGKLQRAFAAVGVVATVVVAVMACSLLMSAQSGFSTRTDPSTLETVLARTMRRFSLRETRLRGPSVSEEALAEARMHWASHCASCHAPDGSGETTLGRGLYPRVPDLRTASSQQLSDGEIYAAINKGIRLTGMPAWGEPGDDDAETWALVAFIRTLPTLSDAARTSIIENLPRTPREENEDREEDDFLRGDSSPPQHHEEHQ